MKNVRCKASRTPFHPEITANEQVGLLEFPPSLIGIKRKNHGFNHFRAAVGTGPRIFIDGFSIALAQVFHVV